MFPRCPHPNVRLVWTKYNAYGDTFAAPSCDSNALSAANCSGRR
jgi:hypothetical protein